MNKIFLLISSVLTMVAPQLKSKDSKEGIKETKEALIGINEVGLHLSAKMKDGVQVKDFVEFYAELQSDPDFKAKLEAAWENHKAIPAEVKDVDAGEGIELAVVQIGYAEKLVEIFSGKAS
jgi:hypothetical protein